MSQGTLFGNTDEPEEGKVPKDTGRKLRPRQRMLLDWIRANGPVTSTEVPLGMKAGDLRELAFMGFLEAEGAQVRTYRIAKGV